MHTMTKLLNLGKTGDMACSLDLQDVYLHVTIFQKYRKYLRFAIGEPVYQFKILNGINMCWLNRLTSGYHTNGPSGCT